MTTEDDTTDIANTDEDIDGEGSEDEDLTIEEEFKSLWVDAQEMEKKLLRLAQSADEEKNKTEAKMLRLIAGDVLPLISDMISASGLAFEEIASSGTPGEDDGFSLNEDEIVQLYITIASSARAFSQLQAVRETEGLEQLIQLNQSALDMLRENFGEDLVEAANLRMQEAAES